ncbi:hypothetical protein KY5_6497c [Streptomyces formicae]|uniref:Uncharacterized protein n=1 Tax=Streptomyces formicae TaxID=1616117 RepID=A0A291QJ94_9ACTN|nr:hypothetical protein KY5_6497c [Streptomyces formicae]
MYRSVVTYGGHPPVRFVVTDQLHVVVGPLLLVPVLDLVPNPVGFPSLVADLPKGRVIIECKQRRHVPDFQLTCTSRMPHTLCLLQGVAQSVRVYWSPWCAHLVRQQSYALARLIASLGDDLQQLGCRLQSMVAVFPLFRLLPGRGLRNDCC